MRVADVDLNGGQQRVELRLWNLIERKASIEPLNAIQMLQSVFDLVVEAPH